MEIRRFFFERGIGNRLADRFTDWSLVWPELLRVELPSRELPGLTRRFALHESVQPAAGRVEEWGARRRELGCKALN
jgi:hypothetical protein